MRVVAERNHLESGVKVGDVIYVLHYIGEGYWKVWHNGQLVEIENFSDKGPYPHYKWWVKLRTSSGIVGWAISPRQFL